MKNEHRTYCLAITEEERRVISVALDKLNNTAPDQDTKDLAESIDERLVYIVDNPAACETYFINIYEEYQAYGGPEEGGWYYPQAHCTYSQGFWCDSELCHPFNHLYITFYALCEEYGLGDVPEASLKAFDIAVSTNDCFSVSMPLRGAYGYDLRISVERGPGASNDTHKHHYE